MSGRTLLTHIELVLLKRKWKLRQPITLIKLVHNMEYSHPYFFIIIMVRVGSIPIMIAVRSNLSRLILTGA
jgi:hypothetical protein